MFTFIRILIVSITTVMNGSVFAQDARPILPLSEIAQRTNCVPICGTPTCCIARSVAIPVCSISGRSAVGEVYRALRQKRANEVLNSCTKAAGGWRGILDEQAVGRVNSLDCKWGCCDSSTVIMSVRQTPTFARPLFAGTELAQLGSDITSSSSYSINDKLDQLEGELIERQSSICIFCCRF
jgi:hypothetical protein